MSRSSLDEEAVRQEKMITTHYRHEDYVVES